jgi:hypothetical protein|tara:strand:- start:286 stop:1224 length:939 start_codon:yes stop_codon:yes gene_type:complete
MEKNKLLVVYNTCGFSGREPVDWYIDCIQNLLNQDLDGVKVVLSSCGNSGGAIKKLFEAFGRRIVYNLINDRITVNMSFNHTVAKCVEKFGEFEGYLYIDSGINFRDNTTVLSKAYELFKSDNYGMVTVQASNDNGFPQWIGVDKFVEDENFVIPVGRACNLHTQIFSNEIFKAFDNKIIPDIFVAYCTESVFSFLAAATNQRWVILKDVVAEHLKSVDGATCGFDHTGPKGDNKNNLFANLDIYEICKDPEALASGFGYEEMQGVLHHDPTKYDENGMVEDSERLKEFIRTRIFLNKEQFNYDAITHKFVG